MWEHSPSAPERSRAVYAWAPERMQRALLSPHAWGLELLGLGGEWQQATRLHHVRKEYKLGLIGTENFTDQHETE